MNKLGLLGKNISYSFSKSYFKDKFENEQIDNVSYENFDIETIELFPSLIKNTKNLKGLNVTIPYKESVIPFLDELDDKAKEIGAVNTIRITKKNKLIGYNTDYYGFKKSLTPFLKNHHKQALILGTGGASKAIAYSLKQLNIKYCFVSRTAKKGVEFTYNTLTKDVINQHQIIINCTPLGTSPNVDLYPDIPYDTITSDHILYDLIYNPGETKFLKQGKQQNATTINGLNMLKFQAEKAWSIWKID
ncbi:shikimate dehydrogenase [Yeosuana marina]|uniref:shikimate dehydrogenase family protein n=1 Tax=Yeosuana marina TaxID=1565536 RepID=UPI0030ED24F6|tara:strand:+ start:116 stop:856 length:741 start_codon:yes stop_codon:yes gene_type:complete